MPNLQTLILLSFLACCGLSFSVFAAGPPVTANMDTGSMSGSPQNVWYERGFNTNAPATGLPPAGVAISSQAQADHRYILQEYRGSNAVLVSAVRTNAALTLSVPSAFAALSFLASAGGGPANVKATAHHEDKTTESGTFLILDWFDGTNVALVADGRFDMVSRSFNSVSSGNPRLYAYELALTNSSPVDRIEFDYVRKPGQTAPPYAAIFAVSGSSGADFVPIAVTGFTCDLVIEAGYRGFEWPNLSGRVQSISPSQHAAGDIAHVSFAVSNNGAGTFPEPVVAFYFSTNRDSFAAWERQGELALPALAGSESAVRDFALQIPAALEAGIYNLLWWINPQSDFDEYRVDDNRGFVQIAVGPNLVVTPLEIDFVPQLTKREVTLGFDVMNSGTVALATKATIYFGTEWGPSPNAIRVGELDVPSLDPEDPPFHARLTFEVPDSFSDGFYTASVWADSIEAVQESFEGDNRGGMWITVPRAQPRIALSVKKAGPGVQIQADPPDARVLLQSSIDLLQWSEVRKFQAGEAISFESDFAAEQTFFRLIAD